MAQRIGGPYWLNWLQWHLSERHRRDNALQRWTTWQFLNRIRSMPRGSLVIDCGANVGSVTSAFVRRGFCVHAFEPDPLALQVLTRRYGGNPLVTIHPQAVGVEDGRMTLYRTRKFERRPKAATKSSSLYRRNVHGDTNSVDVEVVDLSKFIENLQQPVDLLKLDVEGAEVELVEHLIDRGIHKKIGIIFAETHERHSADIAARTLQLKARIVSEGIDNINLDWR